MLTPRSPSAVATRASEPGRSSSWTVNQTVTAAPPVPDGTAAAECRAPGRRRGRRGRHGPPRRRADDRTPAAHCRARRQATPPMAEAGGPSHPDLRPRRRPGDPGRVALLQGAAGSGRRSSTFASARSRRASSAGSSSGSARRALLDADGRAPTGTPASATSGWTTPASSTACSPTSGCCASRWSATATRSPPAGPRRPGPRWVSRRARSDDGQPAEDGAGHDQADADDGPADVVRP